jgi:hypothetical protein
VCPRCGSFGACALIARRKFKCRAAECRLHFSVTSGTIFASRKLPFTDLLVAIAIFVNAVKGCSALQLRRDLDVRYKTAFVLAYKLREALGAQVQGVDELDGEVELDGAYFDGYLCTAKEKKDRVDCRKANHQTDTRRVVIAFRERARRVLPFVCREEAEGVGLAAKHVSRMATMNAD